MSIAQGRVFILSSMQKAPRFIPRIGKKKKKEQRGKCVCKETFLKKSMKMPNKHMKRFLVSLANLSHSEVQLIPTRVAEIKDH